MPSGFWPPLLNWLGGLQEILDIEQGETQQADLPLRMYHCRLLAHCSQREASPRQGLLPAAGHVQIDVATEQHNNRINTGRTTQTQP